MSSLSSVKVSLTTTNKRCKGGHLHAKALPGSPFDGHTLREVLQETQALSGREIERVYVYKGYRGPLLNNRQIDITNF